MCTASPSFLLLLLASVVSMFHSCSAMCAIVVLDVPGAVAMPACTRTVVVPAAGCNGTGTGTDTAVVGADPCWQSKHMMLCI